MRSTRLATRALVGLALATGALAVLATGATPAPASAAAPAKARTADESADTPLRVTMKQLSPSTMPIRGALTITGVVENRSEEEWTDVNVSPFVSRTPITTRDELAEAAATPADTAVGERLVDPAVQIAVGDLGPGQRSTFTLQVPVAEVALTAPGVYWIGVHALGANVEGRDTVADGRARTFISVLPKAVARNTTVPVSIVLPLRDRARRASDGSLNGPARWVNLTKPEGRLSRLSDFAASAGSAPLTWLVDPAVLDALQDFANGNPPLSLGPAEPRTKDDADGDGDGDGEDPAPSPSPAPTQKPVSGAPSEQERDGARTVLDRLLTSARDDTVFTLGYGDPDVASLSRRGPKLLRRSEELASQSLAAHGLTGPAVVAPPQGYFDPDLLGQVPETSLVLLSDHGDLGEPVQSRLPSGQDLVLRDERTLTGGPSPNRPRTALALRQRILAEAALEVAGGEEPIRPLVVSLPPRWDPGTFWRQADFFAGLQVPWVRLTSLSRGSVTPYDAQLAYPKAQLADEVPSGNVAATRDLARTSTVLDELLANDNDVTDKLTEAALQASSYSAKPTLTLAADQVRALESSTRAQLDRVEVTGTEFVTLSGGSGSLTVTLVNGLEQPITVGIRARTDSPDVTVQTPEPVSMQPHQRTTLRLQVRSKVGVHEVTLDPVTTEGARAGSSLTFSLRTSQVGRLIWFIMAGGGVLLAVMIVRRTVLRIRLNRWRVREQ